MAVATWNATVIAESEKTVVIEGNHYFPLALETHSAEIADAISRFLPA